MQAKLKLIVPAVTMSVSILFMLLFIMINLLVLKVSYPNKGPVASFDKKNNSPLRANVEKSQEWEIRKNFLIPLLGAIVQGSPAEKSGPLPGNAIIKVNDMKITDYTRLVTEVEKTQSGTPMKIEVLRNKSSVTLLVTIHDTLKP